MNEPHITDPAVAVAFVAGGEQVPPTAEEATAKDRLAEVGVVFRDGAEFLQSKPEPPKWIVEDFIALHMKGDLCGSSKTFKTYLALLLVICVATGTDFLKVYKVAKPHVVVYLNLELFDWNFHERLKAATSPSETDPGTGKISGGLGISSERLRGHLYVVNLRGRADRLRDRVPDLVAYMKDLGAELVVVDPRYKLLKPGEDENTGDGLRGILDLRDALAEHFAVMIVTHDPKGDTTQKKTTDRGAGSYFAGADFDFRFTIDCAAGWTEDNLVYVVEAGNRARKSPPKVGVRFDCRAQLFRADDDIPTEKLDPKTAKQNAASAAKEEAWQKAYREAALKVVGEAIPGKLYSCEEFDARVAKEPGASTGVNRRPSARNILVREGVLATCAKLERKQDGSVGAVASKVGGCTFVSTPERIARYISGWGLDPSKQGKYWTLPQDMKV